MQQQLVSSSHVPLQRTGAYQKYQTQNYSGEVFVSKLSQDESYLVWSMIVGGTGASNASWPDGFALDAHD
jgi:hypothetical protein